MTTRTLSLQLEEDFTTHTAALFVSHVNVFQSTIRIIAGERSINAKKSSRGRLLRLSSGTAGTGRCRRP